MKRRVWWRRSCVCLGSEARRRRRGTPSHRDITSPASVGFPAGGWGGGEGAGPSPRRRRSNQPQQIPKHLTNTQPGSRRLLTPPWGGWGGSLGTSSTAGRPGEGGGYMAAGGRRTFGNNGGNERRRFCSTPAVRTREGRGTRGHARSGPRARPPGGLIHTEPLSPHI